MPDFDTYVDVEPSEFVYACSKREIKELINVLIDQGHIAKSFNHFSDDLKNILDLEWDNALDKLSINRLHLTNEEEELIYKIANRF